MGHTLAGRVCVQVHLAAADGASPSLNSPSRHCMRTRHARTWSAKQQANAGKNEGSCSAHGWVARLDSAT